MGETENGEFNESGGGPKSEAPLLRVEGPPKQCLAFALAEPLTATSIPEYTVHRLDLNKPSSAPGLPGFSHYPQSMLAKRLPRCSLRPKPRFLTTTRSLRAEDPLHSHPGSSGGHHGDHYDPPAGWLWGLRPGEKYEKEGWEGLFYYGFYGSFVVAAIAYAFKPDTS